MSGKDSDRAVIIGIDPGKSGGISMVLDRHSVRATKMPDTEADIFAVLEDCKQRGPVFCYIEKVHSMPKQGVKSTFTFGQNYGFLRGCLISLGIPFEEVTPQKWQKALSCQSKGDKNVTKAKAQQLFPQVKITHAIADALLIAEYGRRIERCGDE